MCVDCLGKELINQLINVNTNLPVGLIHRPWAGTRTAGGLWGLCLLLHFGYVLFSPSGSFKIPPTCMLPTFALRTQPIEKCYFGCVVHDPVPLDLRLVGSWATPMFIPPCCYTFTT